MSQQIAINIIKITQPVASLSADGDVAGAVAGAVGGAVGGGVVAEPCAPPPFCLAA